KDQAVFSLPQNGVAGLLAWTPDGRMLVSFGPDPAVRVWDATPALKNLRPREEKLTAERLNACWEKLLVWDPAEAEPALGALDSAPEQAVELLRKHLTPVVYPKADADRIARLIAELDANTFDKRYEARTALVRLGRHQVEAAVQAELKKKGLSVE